ncbi:a092ce34-76b9-4849-9a76-5ab66fabef74 [Sclerotinia trifoliorum]|uniref:A092ce34-76b9-4849-9a76-5ab66fabef74 n=1 Tax=Sclerotinia trifoliorum TaxID=28548 RepID=A0A8H2VPN5_9HELO|nr:a092ce34-76b9-4849-9a76-5ab66fabef74 [Sclerotinia trifoliorum]
MNFKEKEKHGRSEAARRNTLQRMLDLEKKSKLQRMQASTTTVSQPLRNTFFRERGPSIPNVYTYAPPPERPTPIRQSERAMTAPTLSVAIPPTQSSEKPETKIKQPKNVVLIEPVKEKLLEVEADADGSDASSICRSPAWDGGDGKQRRIARKEAQDLRRKEDERLKKEKEKAEKETRAAALKQKGRLSKTPPTNKRLSKTVPAVPVGRAKSEPAVPVTPEITQLGPDPDDGRRSRRTSLDLGLKKLMSSFRSRSRSTSASATPRTQSMSSSPNSSGFIGGVKLQQSNENQAQKEPRDGKSSNTKTAGHGNKSSQSRPPISLENSRYRALDLLSSSGTGSPAVELPVKSQTEDTSSPLNLVEPEPSKQPSGDLEPIMSRNPRARKPSENFRSDHITESTVNKAKPQSPVAPPSPGFRFGLEKHQTSKQEVQEPFYFQNFDTPPEAVNSESNEYFPKQKRHNKLDQSSSSHDMKLDAASKKEIVTRTPSIHNANGRSKSVSRSRNDSESVENGESFHAFLDGEGAPPGFKLTAQASQSSIQPEEGMFSRRNLQESSLYPSPLSTQRKGDKDATTTTLGKHLSATNSPSLQTSQLDAPLKELRAQPTLSPRANGFDSRSALPSQSSRRVSEPEYSSPVTSAPSGTNPASREKVSPQAANVASPRRQKKDRRSSSRSFTASSEEYLSFDEQSNITTPAASRPQSQKGPIGSSHDTTPRQYHKFQDSWNQTPLPIRLKDENGNTTLNGGAALKAQSKNPHASLASADPNTEAGVAELQRRLSLNKSSSTTALQNTLNFLPKLKHQPLRPRKAEGRRQISEENNVLGNRNENVGRVKRESASASAYAQYNDSKNSLMSSPVLNGGESSNSNGNSSSSERDNNNNNESSQYLRSARLAIPPKKGPRSSAHQMAASSAQSLHSNGQGGIEPMAKMFVICCGCKYFHDLPSKLYECMAKPEAVVKDEGLGVSGVVSTRVSCPWCGHGMSTRCCEGWAAVVVLKERLH